uniref:G domain-containing protein n=1 Tax=Ditylum brightwellii TaxID=49249 RepID=A0A6U4A9F3_9STRA|mmetsp:Transcript_12092/g.18061  ORF Transcript_12092/g.18061 Transcript_12092/m.18061 type:complete len:598 (-) Transcript_12092:140-1933(-)
MVSFSSSSLLLLFVSNLLPLTMASISSSMIQTAWRFRRYHASSSVRNVLADSISSSSLGAFVSSPTLDTHRRITTSPSSLVFSSSPKEEHYRHSKTILRESSTSSDNHKSSLGYARPLVNWYPGHIAKAERQLSETLKSVDVIIEVRDARAPKATAHPRVAEWTAGRPRVVVLTHTDMIPKKSFNSWKKSYDIWGAGKWDGMVDKQVRNQAMQNVQERQKYDTATTTNEEKNSIQNTNPKIENTSIKNDVDFTSQVEEVLFLDAKRGTGIHSLHRAVHKAGSHVNERRLRRGLNERPLRVGVIGYPNVGKSALINKILGRKRAKSANTPGITRSLQWIRVRTDTSIAPSVNANAGKSKREFELLDSPGIIPSHMIDQSDAFILAACNSIGDAAYDNQLIAGYLCEWVKTLHVMGKGDITVPQWRDKCLQRYGFDPLKPWAYNDYGVPEGQQTNAKKERIMSGEDMLYRVADECCKGDVENAARKILQDYRSGRWGPVSLQLAPETEDDEGQANVDLLTSIAKGDAALIEGQAERQRSEMEEREERAKIAVEMAKERGLELPPMVEKIQEEKEKKDESSSSVSSISAGEVGKGLFDGW